MKIFIVFLAILMLNLSFLCYNTDMDRYMKLQLHLKALAEESAAGASLFIDEQMYAQGVMVIDEIAALAYIDFMVKQSVEHSAIFGKGDIVSQTIIMDAAKGYVDSQRYKIDCLSPAVVVSLCYNGPDLFRLPFVSVESVERTATYQWEDGLTSPF